MFDSDTISIILITAAVVVAIIALLLNFVFNISRVIVRNLILDETKKVERRIFTTNDYQKGLEIYRDNLQKAIALTDRAIASGRLPDETELMAKSSLAYYLAYGKYERGKDRAIKLVEETLAKAYLFPNSTNVIKINYGYVLMSYSETIEDYDKAIKFLKKLITKVEIGNIQYETRAILPLYPHQITEIEGYIKEAEASRAHLFSLSSQ